MNATRRKKQPPVPLRSPRGSQRLESTHPTKRTFFERGEIVLRYPYATKPALAGLTMEFEWDAAKAASNLDKHGVSFAEAMIVFGDPLEATIPDPDHSSDECRLLSMGRSEAGRVLVVAYTEREGRIRLISAREATPAERRRYESEQHG